MQNLLFLQQLGVERQVIDDLIREAGLSLVPTWENWQGVQDPEGVFGIVTVQAAVGIDILDRFPNVRMIAVAFTGHDCLDLDECRRRGIAVYNVPAYSTDSVAELTLALAICLLRDIPGCDRRIREGVWKVPQWGTELAGKTIGIIGTGAIGLQVARLFEAFKCRLIGWSRSSREEFENLGGRYLSKQEVFANADIVTLHLPLDQETEGIVGEAELGWMKLGACLINTARGRVVDKTALVRALEERRIRAALDVFDQEPIAPDDPLVGTRGSLLTPHIAFKTNEALLRRAQVTIRNIDSFLAGSDTNRIA